MNMDIFYYYFAYLLQGFRIAMHGYIENSAEVFEKYI